MFRAAFHGRSVPIRAAGAILLLLATADCATTPMEPACVLALGDMPAGWRPMGPSPQGLNEAPWSTRESQDAKAAVLSGFDELQQYFSHHPDAVAALGTDAVESVIDASYAASNMPDLRRDARDLARKNLMPLLAAYLARPSATANCKEFSTLLALSIHANALLPAGAGEIARMVALTNAAYRSCGSLTAILGYDYGQRLSRGGMTTDEIWDLVMWSITFTDAQLVPGIFVPGEARDLPPALWRYLAHYPFAMARSYPDGARNHVFYDTAYLATHIAYVPTGYDRHPLAIADAPWLYRFLRENFYAVLRMGELDMTAEFVDLFRQYGCTEDNDRQLRDGTRYVLKLYHAAGNRWMAYREPDEPADTGAYNEVHKAWTGMAAVRVRVPEPPAPGTYGGIIRQWLGHPSAD
jgi:hypothetical protein